MSVLDAAGLEALLGWLAPDETVAAEAYERHRRRLIVFFASRGRTQPERLADEVFDRVAAKLVAGESIAATPGAFLLGVARMIGLEELRRAARAANALAAAPPPTAAHDTPDDEEELALRCLEVALARFEPAERQLALDYHAGQGRERIERRHRIASSLGVSTAALRIRLHRLRQRIEREVLACLAETKRSTPTLRGE